MDLLIYAGYLLWLAAGFGDFALHRRSDLPHTSGLAESRMHLAQLAVIGVAVLGWWAMAPGLGAWLLCASLAVAHAVLGYRDTRSAYGRRDIIPLEQHVHSVLDMAPWIFLGVYASQLETAALQPQWRPRTPAVLAMLVLPSLPLALVALGEFRDAQRAARRPPT